MLIGKFSLEKSEKITLNLLGLGVMELKFVYGSGVALPNEMRNGLIIHDWKISNSIYAERVHHARVPWTFECQWKSFGEATKGNYEMRDPLLSW